MQTHTKNHVTLTVIFNRVLEIVEYCSCKLSPCYVQRFMSYRNDRKKGKKLINDAENNTALASVGSYKTSVKHKICLLRPSGEADFEPCCERQLPEAERLRESSSHCASLPLVTASLSVSAPMLLADAGD